MAAPAYSADDYRSAMQSLMPRGRVWPRDPNAVQAKTLQGLAKIYERGTQRANQLPAESNPATTYELLPEWEATLGLPDPCAGTSPTLQGRRAQVAARFAETGGQSMPYMIEFAARLGYTITITQFAPARAGNLRAGLSLCGNDWAFAWQVNAPANISYAFRAGYSAAGEPLSFNNNAVLECELKRVAPAHTTVIFRYS